MKTSIITALAALGLVVTSTSVAAALSGSPVNVSPLSTAESHVLTLLHTYRATATWKNEFKSAIAIQTSNIAKFNAALSPAPTAAGGVLFSQTGTGSETTAPFVVPASAKGWHVNWTYNCASVGGTGIFVVDVYQGTNLSFTDSGVDQLGGKGSGTQHYYDTGQFHLDISSVCGWKLQVVGGS